MKYDSCYSSVPSQCLGTHMHFTGFPLCGLEQQVFSTCASLCQVRTANIVSFLCSCVYITRGQKQCSSPPAIIHLYSLLGKSSRKRELFVLSELRPLSKRTTILAKGERDFFKAWTHCIMNTTTILNRIILFLLQL